MNLNNFSRLMLFLVFFCTLVVFSSGCIIKDNDSNSTPTPTIAKTSLWWSTPNATPSPIPTLPAETPNTAIEKIKELRGINGTAEIPKPDQEKIKVPQVIYEIIDSKNLFDNKEENLSELIIIGEETLSNEPNNVWVRLNLAYFYKIKFQYRKALNHYLVAAEQAPDKADPFIGLGRLYYDLAIIDMAKRNLTTTSPTTGLSIFHPDEKTERVLLEARKMLLFSKEKEHFVKIDKNAKMSKIYTKIYIPSPDTVDTFLEMIESKLIGYYLQKGYELEENRKTTEALLYYNKALDINPDNYVVNFNKGNVLFSLSKFAEAIQSYNNAIITTPYAEAFNNREHAVLQANGIQRPDDPRAMAFLKEDLKSNDNKNRIGAYLLLYKFFAKEAQDVLEKANRDPIIIADLGQVNFDQ